MTRAGFRGRGKEYSALPETRSPAARLAWRLLAQEGNPVSMKLIGGLWTCMRPDGELGGVSAGFIRQCLDAPTAMQSALLRKLAAEEPFQATRKSPAS